MVIQKDKKINPEYESSLSGYPNIHKYLLDCGISGVEKLNSRWRASNLLLKIDCEEDSYVFKQVNVNSPQDEMRKIALLKREFPSLYPELFIFEDNAYLMKYVSGKSFFELDPEERVLNVSLAGELLSQSFNKANLSLVDISEQVGRSFVEYREKRKKASTFFSDDELRSVDFDIFKSVPSGLSHNDLNAANLIYGDSIRLIDPKKEAFNDVAKDVGRYCASCFFNNYDYFGNDERVSLEIAEAFLGHFDKDILERAQYFMGESFLSFLNFDTRSGSEGKLKQLAINLFEKKGNLINLLESGLR